MIWFADGLKPEFPRRLKGLNSPSGHNCRSGVSVWRFPINLSLGVGVPNREYHDMSLAVVDKGFRWRANVQGAGCQGLKFIDLASGRISTAVGVTTTPLPEAPTRQRIWRRSAEPDPSTA